MENLREQIDVLEELGLVEDGRLTKLGTQMDQWIGRADLAYTVQLQRRFEENCDLPELMFWLVATALSNTPLVTLRAQHDFFVDYHRSHVELAHGIDIWSGFSHEDIALFGSIVNVVAVSSGSLFGSKEYRLDDLDDFEFERWCALVGIDGRKLQKAGAAIGDLWNLFCRINGKPDRFGELFGGQRRPSLTSLSWSRLLDDLPVSSVRDQLQTLVGGTTVQLTANEVGGFNWSDTKHGHTGMVSQDDSPIRLRPGITYTARLVPSRETKKVETTWRLAHLGEWWAPETASGKKSWLQRIFDKFKSIYK